jgi:peptidoglycan/LPS O-acetylase OafA/YrhL
MASGAAGLAVNLVVVLAISWVLSSVTYRLVEAPSMRHKARMVPRRIDGELQAPEPVSMESAP